MVTIKLIKEKGKSPAKIEIYNKNVLIEEIEVKQTDKKIYFEDIYKKDMLAIKDRKGISVEYK